MSGDLFDEVALRAWRRAEYGLWRNYVASVHIPGYIAAAYAEAQNCTLLEAARYICGRGEDLARQTLPGVDAVQVWIDDSLDSPGYGVAVQGEFLGETVHCIVPARMWATALLIEAFKPWLRHLCQEG